MFKKLQSILLWPWRMAMTLRLRQLISARCLELEWGGKEVDPRNVLTPEIIDCYIKADMAPEHLEKAILTNTWHEGFHVYRRSPKP